MADQWIQSVAGTESTTTTTISLTGVVAGNTIIVFLWSGSTSTPASSSVADGQGSYSPQTVTAADAVNNVWVKAFTLENANAGTHSITGTLPAGTTAFSMATEVTGPTSAAVSGQNAQAQAGPGTGTDVISSGSVVAGTAATLIAMSADDSSISPSDEPAAGTAFTSRLNGANGTIGAWRVESKSIAANTAATFTAITGSHNFLTSAVAVLNFGAAATRASSLPLLQAG